MAPKGSAPTRTVRRSKICRVQVPTTRPTSVSGPTSLAQWTELHAMIEALPAEEREVMGLIFYQGLTQTEAAEVLNVSVRTLQRRWHAALARLHRVWNVE